MRRWLQFVLLLLVGAAGASHAGEVIDRIVATVNGQPILQSEWDEAIRFEAFLDSRPLEKVDATAARATLDRLIDQELLRQQLRAMGMAPVGPDEVARRLEEVRKQIAEGAGEAAWRAALRRYGLTEDEVKGRLTAQLELLRLIELRLRPSVRVDADSVEAYYRDKFLPQLRQQGGPDPPLVEVSPQIEELLAQQRLDDLLIAWLVDLRKQSDIHLEPLLSGGNRGVEAR